MASPVIPFIGFGEPPSMSGGPLARLPRDAPKVTKSPYASNDTSRPLVQSIGPDASRPATELATLAGGKGGMGGQPAVQLPTQGQYAPLGTPALAGITPEAAANGSGMGFGARPVFNNVATPVGRPPIAPQGGFNVNQAAAGALQQAMGATQQGLGFTPMGITPQSYRPTMQGVSGTQTAYGYNPAQQRMQGMQTGFGYDPTGQRVMGAQSAVSYDPSQQRSMGTQRAVSYDPAQAQAQQLATTDISQYQNPYQQQVIDMAMRDIGSAQETALAKQGAQATAAKAFGGSRQGIAEAETRLGFGQQAADAATRMRQQGFQQAQQAAMFDVGQRASTEAANVAAQQAAQRFGAESQYGAQASNIARQQQVEAANVAARQAAQRFGAESQYGAQAANIAQRQRVEAANAAAETAAAQYGAGSAQAAQAANIARQQQIEAANVAARTGAAQYGAGARTAAQLGNINRAQQVQAANAAAQMQAAQYAAQQRASAQSQNLAAQQAAMGTRLGAASQLAGLGQQAFGTGQAIQQQQMQQGLMQQGLQQALIDAARQQYAGYTGAPQQALTAPLAALGATPNQSTTTQTRQAGLFDYLKLPFMYAAM
jgi:hypothetical protein